MGGRPAEAAAFLHFFLAFALVDKNAFAYGAFGVSIRVG
jgi:hypothetical protein